MNMIKARRHEDVYTSISIKTKKNKLYLENISSINCARKYIKIDKDKLCSKAKNNSLSFLSALEVISTKDKYA